MVLLKPKSSRNFALFVLQVKSDFRLNFFNPLSPNGDQYQFSPNDIHTLSRDKAMRINEMIT